MRFILLFQILQVIYWYCSRKIDYLSKSCV